MIYIHICIYKLVPRPPLLKPDRRPWSRTLIKSKFFADVTQLRFCNYDDI